VKALRETFNKQIIEAMAEEGVSNAELARRLNCTPVNTFQMLRNKRSLELDTVDRLAKALGRKVAIVLTKKNGT
jgi:plasmid maintenance system antidote protein VapI